MRQPVMLKVFERLEIVTVRSRMPGSVAIGVCAPAKTMYSYGSSVRTRGSCAMASWGGGAGWAHGGGGALPTLRSSEGGVGARMPGSGAIGVCAAAKAMYA